MSTAVASDRPPGPSATGRPWYTRDAESVGNDLGVDPANGLASAEVTARLGRDGPTARRCAIALLVTWEIAKAVARHREPSTNGGT